MGFGIFERGTGRVIVRQVEARDRATLLPIILENIAPGTTIYSDKWRPYDVLNALGQGYRRSAVNHTETFVAPDGTCTNNIERIWREIKADLKIMRGTSQQLLPGYLDEYMYRKQHVGQDIFLLMLEMIATQYPC